MTPTPSPEWPLALYIHIPWCVRKCPYCDFNSHAVSGELDESTYVEALLADLEQELPLIRGQTLSSLFIGGGTPSLFSGEAIGRLLEGVRSRIECTGDMEVTLEANPGTLETGRFREYRSAGVTRLSLGIQSFDQEKLQQLGRIHGRNEAIAAAETAHATGFDNFNIDLMFGLPGQTAPEALEDVKIGMALEPAHISYYQLTLEPNTLYHQAPPSLPDDELLCEIETNGQERLRANGYEQYEVSAFSRPGMACRHNLNYWRFGDYIGIGAGAHGKITDRQSGHVERRWRTRSPDRYLTRALRQAALAGQRQLKPPDLIAEFMMNALRLSRGFPTELFKARTGLPFTTIEPLLEQAVKRGLLEVTPESIRPTPKGARFLNELLTLFMP